MSLEEISSMVDKLEREADQIRQENLKLTWYMRGGVTYEQVMNMSTKERTLISEIAKENLETTKKSNLPFF